MERFIFIHGSASGQSSLPFSAASSRLCSEVGKWYFEGRENRIIGTTAPRSMFVELYKATEGNRYCLYSLVHNECFGPAPEPRPGQYFAVTIALQESYCIHPSSIYTILSGAYNQLIRNKIIADKVVISGKEYHNVYTIGQFKDKSAELIDFQNKISTFFDRDCLQLCKPLPASTNLPLPWNGNPMTRMVQNRAERLPWNGETIHPTECDSVASTEKLWKEGRIYVSEEAPLLTAHIQKLQEEKSQLEAKNKALQSKVDNPAPNPKDKKEISSLQAETERLRKDAERANSEKERLQKENRDLVATFDGLSQLINKYKGTTGKQLGIIDKQLYEENRNGNGWKRWTTAPLLLIVLILTLIILVLNICFFRNISSSIDEVNSQNERIGALEQKVEFVNRNLGNTTSFGTFSTSSEKSPSSVTPEPKTSILTEATNQSRITPATEPVKKPDYGLTITDEQGGKIKTVRFGQIIKAHARNSAPSLDWKFDGVEKINKSDVNPIFLKVVKQTGSVTIGYGDPTDKHKRQRMSFKIETTEVNNDNQENN